MTALVAALTGAELVLGLALLVGLLEVVGLALVVGEVVSTLVSGAATSFTVVVKGVVIGSVIAPT